MRRKRAARQAKIFLDHCADSDGNIGQMAENWDTIGYRIEEFIYDEFDIDLNSIFDDSSSDEVNESNEIMKVMKVMRITGQMTGLRLSVQ